MTYLIGQPIGLAIIDRVGRRRLCAAQAASLWVPNVLIMLTLLRTMKAIGTGQTLWMYAAFSRVRLPVPEDTGADRPQP